MWGRKKRSSPVKMLPAPPPSSACPICLCEFGSESMAALIPCWHYFHTECSTGWFKSRTDSNEQSCPLCRCTPLYMEEAGTKKIIYIPKPEGEAEEEPFVEFDEDDEDEDDFIDDEEDDEYLPPSRAAVRGRRRTTRPTRGRGAGRLRCALCAELLAPDAVAVSCSQCNSRSVHLECMDDVTEVYVCPACQSGGEARPRPTTRMAPSRRARPATARTPSMSTSMRGRPFVRRDPMSSLRTVSDGEIDMDLDEEENFELEEEGRSRRSAARQPQSESSSEESSDEETSEDEDGESGGDDERVKKEEEEEEEDDSEEESSCESAPDPTMHYDDDAILNDDYDPDMPGPSTRVMSAIVRRTKRQRLKDEGRTTKKGGRKTKKRTKKSATGVTPRKTKKRKTKKAGKARKTKRRRRKSRRIAPSAVIGGGPSKRERTTAPPTKLSLLGVGLEPPDCGSESDSSQASPRSEPSSPAPSPANPSSDLLGGILSDQTLTLAPGRHIRQENGRFVARDSLSRHMDRVRSRLNPSMFGESSSCPSTSRATVDATDQRSRTTNVHETATERSSATTSLPVVQRAHSDQRVRQPVSHPERVKQENGESTRTVSPVPQPPPPRVPQHPPLPVFFHPSPSAIPRPPVSPVPPPVPPHQNSTFTLIQIFLREPDNFKVKYDGLVQMYGEATVIAAATQAGIPIPPSCKMMTNRRVFHPPPPVPPSRPPQYEIASHSSSIVWPKVEADQATVNSRSANAHYDHMEAAPTRPPPPPPPRRHREENHGEEASGSIHREQKNRNGRRERSHVDDEEHEKVKERRKEQMRSIDKIVRHEIDHSTPSSLMSDARFLESRKDFLRAIVPQARREKMSKEEIREVARTRFRAEVLDRHLKAPTEEHDLPGPSHHQ